MKSKWSLVFCVLALLCLSAGNAFAQDAEPLLKQIIDDYKTDPALGDSNWKDKQIEITAAIIFFDSSTHVMVQQVFESVSYLAWIPYKGLNRIYEHMSEIKIKGTITGISYNPNGSINCVMMTDCEIVE